MPRHDLSDGFDESFFDDILVIRQPESLGANGRNVLSPSAPISTEAVVEALSGATLLKTDYTVGEKVVKVTTRFRLRGPSTKGQPDVIVLDRTFDAVEPFEERYAASPTSFDHYRIDDLSDFSRYGEGFVVATASLVDAQPEPPTRR
jgi:hypothetical protein